MSNLTEAQMERLQALLDSAESITSAITHIMHGGYTKDHKKGLEDLIQEFLVIRLAMNQEGDIKIPPMQFSKIWNQLLEDMRHQDLKP